METCKNCNCEFTVVRPKVTFYGCLVCRPCYERMLDMSRKLEELIVINRKNFNLSFFEQIIND